MPEVLLQSQEAVQWKSLGGNPSLGLSPEACSSYILQAAALFTSTQVFSGLVLLPQ